jgi:hypothetical protein
MSYLDRLRGMQAQFDEARDQAQANTDAVRQSAYVRAESKKNDYLGQIARHYEDIENKLQTGAAVAGGVGALVKHGKRLHATIKGRAKPKEAPDLEKPGTAGDTPEDPTDGAQSSQKPEDDVRSGDLETPRSGDAIDTGLPDSEGGARAEPAQGDIDEDEKAARARVQDFLDDPETGERPLADAPADAAESATSRPGDLDFSGTELGQAPADVTSAKRSLGSDTLDDDEALKGVLDKARTGVASARADARDQLNESAGQTAGDKSEEAPGTEGQDLEAAQRTEAPLEGGEGSVGLDAPGSNILRPNAISEAGDQLSRAAPESSLSDMADQGAKKVAEKVGSKIGGSVVGDVLGDIGMTALDSIPIIGDLFMAGQLIAGAITGAKGTKKETDVEDNFQKTQADQPVATGVASTGFDIKSMGQ